MTSTASQLSRTSWIVVLAIFFTVSETRDYHGKNACTCMWSWVLLIKQWSVLMNHLFVIGVKRFSTPTLKSVESVTVFGQDIKDLVNAMFEDIARNIQ